MDGKIKKISDWLEAYDLVNDMCTFIKRPDAYTRFVTGISGWSWEDQLKKACNLMGLSWEKAESLDRPYEYIINSLKVQCKLTTCVGKCDIRSKNKNNNRRYLIDDFDILAVKVKNLSGDKFFVIPSKALVDSKKDCTSLKGGINLNLYNKYEEAWGLLKKGKSPQP